MIKSDSVYTHTFVYRFNLYIFIHLSIYLSLCIWHGTFYVPCPFRMMTIIALHRLRINLKFLCIFSNFILITNSVFMFAYIIHFLTFHFLNKLFNQLLPIISIKFISIYYLLESQTVLSKYIFYCKLFITFNLKTLVFKIHLSFMGSKLSILFFTECCQKKIEL